MEEKAVRKHKTFIGIVGMRVNPRTKRPRLWKPSCPVQITGPDLLRDTQIYVNAAFNGLSLFDLPEYMSARDLEQWQPLWTGSYRGS